MTETLQLDPATTALVLTEFPNDFTSEGGLLHGAVAMFSIPVESGRVRAAL